MSNPRGPGPDESLEHEDGFHLEPPAPPTEVTLHQREYGAHRSEAFDLRCPVDAAP